MENIQKITMIGFVLIQIEEDIESEDFDELEKLLMTVDYEILAKYASGQMKNAMSKNTEGQVKVFFDMGSTTEWVATFSDERTYDACYDQLEKMAKGNGCTLTESINEG